MEATLYMILMGSEILTISLLTTTWTETSLTILRRVFLPFLWESFALDCLWQSFAFFATFINWNSLTEEKQQRQGASCHQRVDELGQNVVRSFSPSNNCDVLLWRLCIRVFHANHGYSLQRLLYGFLCHVYSLRCYLLPWLRRNSGSSDGLLHHAFPSVPYLFDWLYLRYYIDKQIQLTMHLAWFLNIYFYLLKTSMLSTACENHSNMFSGGGDTCIWRHFISVKRTKNSFL